MAVLVLVVIAMMAFAFLFLPTVPTTISIGARSVSAGVAPDGEEFREPVLLPLVTFSGFPDNSEELGYDHCFDSTFTFEYENNGCPATAHARVMTSHSLEGVDPAYNLNGRDQYLGDATFTYRCNPTDKTYVVEDGGSPFCNAAGCVGEEVSNSGTVTFTAPRIGVPSIRVVCWDEREQQCSDGAFSVAWTTAELFYGGLNVDLITEIPDTDGDGVLDDTDACVDEFGELSNGCPEVVLCTSEVVTCADGSVPFRDPVTCVWDDCPDINLCVGVTCEPSCQGSVLSNTQCVEGDCVAIDALVCPGTCSEDSGAAQCEELQEGVEEPSEGIGGAPMLFIAAVIAVLLWALMKKK